MFFFIFSLLIILLKLTFFFLCHIGGTIIFEMSREKKKILYFILSELSQKNRVLNATKACRRKEKKRKEKKRKEKKIWKHAEHKHGKGISLSTSKQSFHSHIQLTINSLRFHSRSKVFWHIMITENLFWPTV